MVMLMVTMTLIDNDGDDVGDKDGDDACEGDYGKPLQSKVIQFSKPVKNTTLLIEIFMQLVQFFIQGIQFHTFPIEMLIQ